MEKELHSTEHSLIKIIIFHGLILMCLLLTGCKNNSQPANVPAVPETEAVNTEKEQNSVADTITPSLPPATPTITPTPDNVTLESDDIMAVEDAKALVEQGLDLSIYSVSPLADDVRVDDVAYYTFLIKQKNIAIEPVIAVNKITGELFCFSDDGILGDISKLEIYNADRNAVCDWNGDFYRYNILGESDGEIHLSQGDTNSFEFHLFATYHLNMGELNGIAQITGNTASYEDGEGFSLSFFMNDGELMITEHGTNSYAGMNVTFDGTYALNKESASSRNTITTTEAIDLLKTLTISQTGLPADISLYTLLADDMLLIVKDTSCYSISVYSDLGNRMYLMSSYYVATDGSKIYRFDVNTGDDIEIYSSEE